MKLLQAIFTFIISVTLVQAKVALSVNQLNKLTGEDTVPYDNKAVWDQKFNKRVYIYGKAPAKFSAENFSYIGENKKILDIGIGEGRNAVFLAKKGHKVTGIDISSVAIKKSQMLARENEVRIQTILGSVKKYQFAPRSFDAIICFYFVDHSLNEKLLRWLKPGGVLIYEAYTTRDPQAKEKSNNIEQYLKPKELLHMFPKTEVLKFEEPMHEKRFRAGIILRKI